jgi:hypothetical protein
VVSGGERYVDFTNAMRAAVISINVERGEGEVCPLASAGRFWKYCVRRSDGKTEWKPLRFLLDSCKKLESSLPVQQATNDLNALMLKFKYDSITDTEYEQFTEEVNKLYGKAYERMFRSSPISYEEGLQNVWQRLLMKRHTWNEDLAFAFSTWFWRIVQSELGTMKYKDERRNNHGAILYMHDDDAGFDENEIVDVAEGQEVKLLVLEAIDTFRHSLRGTDAQLISLVLDVPDEVLDECNEGRKRKRNRMYLCDLQKVLGLFASQLKTRIERLRKRFYAHLRKQCSQETLQAGVLLRALQEYADRV